MKLIALFVWFKENETLLLCIVTTLLAFEQWIASTPRLKSNSTLQLIGNFISGVINVIRMIYRVSAGRAMITPLDTAPILIPATPSIPAIMEKAITSPAVVLSGGELAVFQKALEHGETSINTALKATE